MTLPPPAPTLITGCPGGGHSGAARPLGGWASSSFSLPLVPGQCLDELVAGGSDAGHRVESGGRGQRLGFFFDVPVAFAGFFVRFAVELGRPFETEDPRRGEDA